MISDSVIECLTTALHDGVRSARSALEQIGVGRFVGQRGVKDAVGSLGADAIVDRFHNLTSEGENPMDSTVWISLSDPGYDLLGRETQLVVCRVGRSQDR